MKIYSWGSNSHGQLGQGTAEEQILYPLPIDTAIVEPRFISGGGKHTVLLTSNNEVFLCGDNDKGQLGQKPTEKVVNVFHRLTFQLKVERIACGWDFNLVLTENSDVFGWGSNSFGQLGLSLKKVKYLSTPHKIFDSKVLNIGAGLRHSAIITSDGLIFTAGCGRKGQLGVLINKKNPPVLDKFTLVESIKNCSKISCGECHCIAITAAKEVYSWGNNKYGQLGIDPATTLFSATPVQIKFNEIIRSSKLYSGWSHNFILTDEGQLVSWGRNDFGQLGEQRQCNWKPEQIKNLDKVKQVSLGSHHCVVLTEFDEVLTWGWNEHGSCGNGNCKNSLEPNKLQEFSSVKLVGSGAAHSFLCLDCGKREYNVQKKCSMKLFDYLRYWEEYNKYSNKMDCLYLKDWHFMKEYPSEKVYRVPPYFASDWLNEYYDDNTHLNDDYRFVYIGPKGSWTPLHTDVFTSYSWSVNIFGTKKWILFPPGTENYLKDTWGNLIYDIDLSDLKNTQKKIRSLEVIQEEGQALFIPSGWHHQVWNLEDTISINHNWINGCNLHYIWSSLKRKLSDVMKEISDCRDMENWMGQCQLVLAASFGFDYQFFYSLLEETAQKRIHALNNNKNLNVYGNWAFGENHMKFDLKRILTVLNGVEKDENFLEITKAENNLNHALEFLDSLTSFLNSKEF